MSSIGIFCDRWFVIPILTFVENENPDAGQIESRFEPAQKSAMQTVHRLCAISLRHRDIADEDQFFVALQFALQLPYCTILYKYRQKYE